MNLRALAIALLVAPLLVAASSAAWSANEPGRLTGGSRYEIPEWFKESFLEMADDAAEAAEADKHVMLFMHLDECPYCAAVLRESIVESDYSAWLRSRFDAIAINIRGDRRVVFNEELSVTEKELAQALQVRQTPTIIFLDGANRTVMRADGYRTSHEFKRILDYVDSKSYLSMDLATFIARNAAGPHYTFRPHPAFRQLDDLSNVDRPLMVIFEDAYCDGCELFHDTLLADAEVNDLLEKFVVVRLDSEDERPLVDPAGRKTTAKAWSREIGMATRPSILLFDGATERVRIEGVLRHFHFTTALRYVGESKYFDYPTLSAYSRERIDALLKAGVSVDLGRQ